MDSYFKVGAFWIVTVLLCCSAAYLCRDVICPFIFGGVLAYIFAPVVDRFSKRLNRSFVCLMITSLFLCVIVATLLCVVPFWDRELKKIATNIPNYIDIIYNFIGSQADELKKFGFDVLAVKSNMQAYVINNINLLVSWLVKLISKTEMVTRFFSGLFIIHLTLFYILKDWDVINQNIMSIVPIRSRKSITDLQNKIRICVSKFLSGQLLVGIILSCYYMPSLAVVGVESPIFWGVLSGIAAFIPFLGAVFCCGMVSIVCLLSGFAFIKLVIIIGIYLVGQFLEGYVLSPKFVGHEVDIHPLLLLFAFFIGIDLGGVLGVLVCVPCMAVLSVIARFFMDKFRSSNFFKQG